MATAVTIPTPTRIQPASQAQPLRLPRRPPRRLILHLHHPRRLIPQPHHLHQPTLLIRRLRRPILPLRRLRRPILRSRRLHRPIPPLRHLLHHPDRLATLIRLSRAIQAPLRQSIPLDITRTLLLTHLTPAIPLRTRTPTRLIRLVTQQATQPLPRHPSPLPTHPQPTRQEGSPLPRP